MGHSPESDREAFVSPVVLGYHLHSEAEEPFWADSPSSDYCQASRPADFGSAAGFCPDACRCSNRAFPHSENCYSRQAVVDLCCRPVAEPDDHSCSRCSRAHYCRWLRRSRSYLRGFSGEPCDCWESRCCLRRGSLPAAVVAAWRESAAHSARPADVPDFSPGHPASPQMESDAEEERPWSQPAAA